MIPHMNASSVLPPYVGPEPGAKADMSPYVVSMSDVVARFATSLERVAILRGLLSYRDAVRALGLTEGHQWLDGSFVEDVESVRKRPPQDIDIVTFTPILGTVPEKRALVQTNLAIFDSAIAKKTFHCDAFFVDLSIKPLLVVDWTRYWFGLFSHQRVTNLWKGILQVPLLSDDVSAGDLLSMLEQGLGGGQNA